MRGKLALLHRTAHDQSAPWDGTAGWSASPGITPQWVGGPALVRQRHLRCAASGHRQCSRKRKQQQRHGSRWCLRRCAGCRVGETQPVSAVLAHAEAGLASSTTAACPNSPAALCLHTAQVQTAPVPGEGLEPAGLGASAAGSGQAQCWGCSSAARLSSGLMGAILMVWFLPYVGTTCVTQPVSRPPGGPACWGMSNSGSFFAQPLQDWIAFLACQKCYRHRGRGPPQ